jgi:RNA-binding motif X-linked protein 2
MNTIREIEKINQQELDRGIAGTSGSWHSQFANAAWCYLGNLDHQLTEGDILCIMSQYGEVEDIHLVREEDTGKSRGFAFLKYEDTRSCVLAVDNFCGVTILGRSLRVDHVEQYRLPKKLQEQEEDASEKPATSIDNDDGTGHAYKGMEFENNYNIQQGMDLFAPQAPAKDKKNLKKSGGTDENDEHSARIKRKEDRQRKRLEKEERRQRREEKREKHEEKKRKKRAREHHGDRKADKKYKRSR